MTLIASDCRECRDTQTLTFSLFTLTCALGGYGGHDQNGLSSNDCSYLHSYNGQPLAISTVLGAIQEENFQSVTFVQGSMLTENITGGIEAAVSAALKADLVILTLGLSGLVEAEGRDRSTLRCVIDAICF
jgi:hypothetical protein